MSVVEITNNNEYIDNTYGSAGIVVVKVGASWCKACVDSDPAFDALAASDPDTRYYRVAFDKVNFADKHAIGSLPSYLCFKDGCSTGVQTKI